MSETGAQAPAKAHKRKQDGQQTVGEQSHLCKRAQRGSETSTDTVLEVVDEHPAYIGGVNSRMPVDGWFQACRCQAAYARAAADGSIPPWLRRVFGKSQSLDSLAQRQDACQAALARLEDAWTSLTSDSTSTT